jgi:hypothetical protein
MRWYYFYLPRHVAGSGGNTYIGKVEDTEANIRARFNDCATIDGQVVTFHSRPKSSR